MGTRDHGERKFLEYLIFGRPPRANGVGNLGACCGCVSIQGISERLLDCSCWDSSRLGLNNSMDLRFWATGVSKDLVPQAASQDDQPFWVSFWGLFCWKISIPSLNWLVSGRRFSRWSGCRHFFFFFFFCVVFWIYDGFLDDPVAERRESCGSILHHQRLGFSPVLPPLSWSCSLSAYPVRSLHRNPSREFQFSSSI